MQPRELYKTQQYATAIYQSELAIRLKELGYNLQSSKNGLRKLRAIPRNISHSIAPDDSRFRIIFNREDIEGGCGSDCRPSYSWRQASRRCDKCVTAIRDRGRFRRSADARRQGGSRTRSAASSTPNAKHARVAVTYARDKNMEREAVVEARNHPRRPETWFRLHHFRCCPHRI